jgi:hypothetical protein
MVPRMGFEPMNSYKSGCLLGVKPLACDLESTAVDQLGYLGSYRRLFNITIKPFPFLECFTLLPTDQIEESSSCRIIYLLKKVKRALEFFS